MAYTSKHTGSQIDDGITAALGMAEQISKAVAAEATIRQQADEALRTTINGVSERVNALEEGGGSSSGGGENYVVIEATASSRVDLDAITTAGTYRIMGDIDFVDNMPAFSVPESFKPEVGVVLRVAEGATSDGKILCTQELIIPAVDQYFLRAKLYFFTEWLSPVTSKRVSSFSFIDEGVYLDCTQGSTTTSHGITVNAGDKFDLYNRESGTQTHQVLFHYPASGAMNIYIRSNAGSNTDYRKVLTE